MSAVHRHILIMSSWFPNRLDPHVGNFIQRYAALLARNYEVSVIHTIGDRSCKRIEVDEQMIDGVRTVVAYHPVHKTNRLWHWWSQRQALRAAMKRVEDVDLLFAHVLLPRGLQFIKAKHYYNCPLLVLEHASYFRPEMRKKISQVQRTIMKRTSLYIKQLLAVSDVLRKDMKPLFPTTQIELLPNFVQLDLFPLNPEKKEKRRNFVCISTLDPLTKNPEMLFKGFQNAVQNELKSSGTCDLSLTIISDQNTDKWQTWVRDQDLEAYIRFEGPYDWKEIGARMQDFDALILTSDYETFNIGLAEAWLTGMPVIATSVGIAHELPEFLGRQVSKKNDKELGQIIMEFAQGNCIFDPEQIRQHALQYGDEHVLQQLISLFERYFDYHD